MEIPQINLRKQEEKRIKGGHPWVYSNEIDTKKTPLKGLEPGSQVIVNDHNDKELGVATVNPNSLIAARLFTRNSKERLNQRLLVAKIEQALAIRQQIFSEPFYRLVYGESDGIPGLVVDRFGEYLVVQLNTQGMDKAKDTVISALNKVLKPTAILIKNDSTARVQEGLEKNQEIIGEWPDQIMVRENGVEFMIDPVHGQKTGWFYDHRQNRSRLQDYVKMIDGAKVLDLYSYVGGWGLQAAAAGAASVRCVDSSEKALQQLRASIEHNQLQDIVSAVQGDVFKVAEELIDAGERFDIVVADPPAFIKKRKDIRSGTKGYQRLYQLCLRLLNPNGLLVACSCSMHYKEDAMLDTLRGSGRHVDRFVRILERGGQGADHPIHPAIAETQYLKAIFCSSSYSS